jgi:hypothetical protein
MRLISAVMGLSTLLLIAPLMNASASPPPRWVSPDSVKNLPYTFVFTNEDRDGLIQVGVTVTPKTGSLSPGLPARLHLIKGKTELATIPLEETRENGKVTYWFRITPAFVAESRFDFNIQSGNEETLPNGKTRFVAKPGTLEYWFNLHDFVAVKAAKSASVAAVRKSRASQRDFDTLSKR